jgi:peptidoglycan L-alanyl-D-glutamate endopeptidase CwlK
VNFLQWFRKLWRKPSNAGPLPILANSSPSLPPKSTPAPKTKPTTSEAKASDWQADPRSEKNLATLEPQTAKLAREHLRRLSALGLTFKITSGTRTFAEQARLYAQGRTAKGPKVTNARPGSSWHNFGTAYDLTLFSGKNPVWESKHYDTAGRIGEELGLEWGGRWTRLVDRPHFQRPLGLTLAEARRKYPTGVVA